MSFKRGTTVLVYHCQPSFKGSGNTTPVVNELLRPFSSQVAKNMKMGAGYEMKVLQTVDWIAELVSHRSKAAVIIMAWSKF